MNATSISSLEFGMYSAEEIRSLAVCKLDSSKLSGPGTVYDPRMGFVMDTNSESCPTCSYKKDCIGHFGYIELNEPVLHPLFYKSISTFLKCFCKKCHKLSLTEEQLELSNVNKLKGHKRFLKIVEKIEKNVMCSHCSSPQPKIIYKTKDNTIYMEYKQKKGKETTKVDILLGVEDIKEIFDDITDADVRLLGFDPKRTHPRNLIITALPVIPTCSRPCVMADGNVCDDDLTYQYTEIIKINNNLASESLTDKTKPKLIQSLNFRIKTLFNNSNGKAKHPTDSRALKALKERLVGKGGRARGNMMGKRVDWSARTVITADPTISTGTFGIPEEVAITHTKPETVTRFNKEYLTELVQQGKANHITTFTVSEETGEKVATRKDLRFAMYKKGTELLYKDSIIRNCTKKYKIGTKISEEELKQEIEENGGILIPVVRGDEKVLEGDMLYRDGCIVELKNMIRKDIKLELGNIVERHLQNGDVVLVNRQPTLHRGSMLSHTIHILKNKSFRMNLAATKQMNAD